MVIPDLARAGADLSETLARMNRPETSVLGKPVEQLKGWLGVGAGFDEQGAVIAYSTAVAGAADGAPSASWTLLLPATDPKALVESLGTGADGALTFMGTPAFCVASERFVVVSERAELARGHEAKGGSAKAFLAAVGADMRVRVDEAELLAWAGPEALARAKAMGATAADLAQRRAAEQGAPIDPFAARKDDVQRVSDAVLGSLEQAALLVDIDALGLAVRPVLVLAPDGALAKSIAPAAAGAAPFSLLPKAPIYGALSIDVQALGGGASLRALAAAVDPAGALLPGWLLDAAASIQGIQAAAYPSKLGIMAGGLLNDSSLVITTTDPASVEKTFKEKVLSMGGTLGGVRLVPSWEDARVLKDGSSAAAFEVKPEPIADGAVGDAAAGAMQMLATQAMFGSRGMHGFVRTAAGGLVVTYSQRLDVLTRATQAQAGQGATLADDAVVKSMLQWMVPAPEITAFVGIGQLMKAARQVVGSFGGNAATLPPVPSRAEPIGIAFDVGSRRIEGAVVIPTAVLAAMAEFAASENAQPAPGSGQGARPDGDDAPAGGEAP